MKIIKMIKVLRTSDSGQDVKLGTEFTPPPPPETQLLQKTPIKCKKQQFSRDQILGNEEK